jgi:hypothetical protein
MTIIAGIFGVIGRFAGKLLTTTLGWASVLLFGRVPGNRQIVLAIVTFGSVVWAALVIGVVLPYVGTFLLAAVPSEGVVEESWLRLGMLIGALVVPAVVGVATLFVVEPANRPKGKAIIGQVLRGYPLSAVLAFTLVLLAAVGVARFIHHLVKRWSDAHVAVVVKPGRYEKVLADVERALDDAGLDVTPVDAPGVLSVPGRLLGSIAGPGIKSLVPDRLVQLRGEGLEVGLYPSDIAISGDKVHVARARAAIASRLVATDAWLTTSAEAQEIEERLGRLTGADVPGGAPGATTNVPAEHPNRDAELRAIDEQLAVLEVPYEEWEVLYRERLQVERDLLAGVNPGGSFPGATEPSGGLVGQAGDAGRRSSTDEPLPEWVGTAVAAAGLVLIAADVGLTILGRVRR